MTPKYIPEEWDDWEEENPERVSKSHKPKHGVSGRSVFTLWQTMRNKYQKAKNAAQHSGTGTTEKR